MEDPRAVEDGHLRALESGNTVCICCKYHRHIIGNCCVAPDAPIHDFIKGYSYCAKVNLNGRCRFFALLDSKGE